MQKSRLHGAVALALTAFTALLAACSGGDGPRSFADATRGLEHQPGLVDLYLERKAGKVYLAFPAPEEETGILGRYIYARALTAGLGSNPVGLDRGSWASTDIVAFRLAGGKLVAEAENWRYRASAERESERKAVATSFAKSVLWTAPVTAREEDTGRVLVEVTGFLLRDAMDLAGRLKAADQGDFSLDAERSFVELDAALAFPENVEFDAVLTFKSAKPGREVEAVTPAPQAVSLTLHHSLVKLPEPGYTPRRADPRAGIIGVEHTNFSAPLDEELTVSLARRFRLEKTDPAAESSPVKNPIVFYVDSGAPEPIRNALMDGISWWAEAFAAAGLENAFEVKALPEDVHPLDARYNVVQWVHRQTRGWSFGGGIYDPRTGEMIKGLIVLGSQRVRQDRMIFEALAGVEKAGSGAADDPVALALDRLRQLGAHEVGHALGFAHNMAASTYGDRASVMDYPAPLIRTAADGGLDFSQAYARGMGAWDRFAVSYLYSDFADDTDEAAALEAMVRKAQADGLVYVADGHSRPPGGAHPLGNLWDNGSDPLAFLEEVLEVRRTALEGFGLDRLRAGEPRARLKRLLVPVYLYHRYQMTAAAKSIGGLTFNYGVMGDGGSAGEIVPAERQRRAIDMLLATVSPAFLDLPDSLLASLTPYEPGFGPRNPRIELFDTRSAPVFDLLSAAETAAALTFDRLLHPARLGRLLEFHRQDAAYPGVADLLETASESVLLDADALPSRQREIAAAVAERYIAGLITLASEGGALPGVVAEVEAHLEALAGDLDGDRLGDAVDRRLRRMIERHLARPAEPVSAAPKPPETPPGSPIGAASGVFEGDCWHCEG